MLNDIFSIDNLWHSLVATVFVVIGTVLAYLIFNLNLSHAFALLAGVGLYLREVSQVDWDFSLKGSRHKHLEWIVGTVVGFATALVLTLILLR